MLLVSHRHSLLFIIAFDNILIFLFDIIFSIFRLLIIIRAITFKQIFCFHFLDFPFAFGSVCIFFFPLGIPRIIVSTLISIVKLVLLQFSRVINIAFLLFIFWLNLHLFNRRGWRNRHLFINSILIFIFFKKIRFMHYDIYIDLPRFRWFLICIYIILNFSISCAIKIY